MKTANLIKALKKAGMEVIQVENSGMNKFKVRNPAEKASRYGWFYDQDGRAVNTATCSIGEGPQGEIDYFPQTYHDTIKSYVRSMKAERHTDEYGRSHLVWPEEGAK